MTSHDVTIDTFFACHQTSDSALVTRNRYAARAVVCNCRRVSLVLLVKNVRTETIHYDIILRNHTPLQIKHVG